MRTQERIWRRAGPLFQLQEDRTHKGPVSILAARPGLAEPGSCSFFSAPKAFPSQSFMHWCLVLEEILGSSQAQTECLSIMGCFLILPSWAICVLPWLHLLFRLDLHPGFQPSPFSHGVFQRPMSLLDLTRQCPTQLHHSPPCSWTH